jgi:acyl-CoA reductase-like NAD-dependent aldehyde dehydrogenase
MLNSPCALQHSCALQQCNCYNVYDAAMPFGGYKASGVGRDKGEEALHNFTQTKVICPDVV